MAMMRYIQYTNFMILLVILNATAIAHKVHVVNIDCEDDTLISRDGVHGCRQHEHCTCRSLDNAFVNPTNNTVYNITADAMLSSLLKGNDLVNITITGHNSPTIKCSGDGGGLWLLSCQNCTIENIIWDGCGVQDVNIHNTKPVILLISSSYVKIINCTFQYSPVGQAIGLSDMTGPGDIIISHCKFLNNHIVPDADGAIGGFVIHYYLSDKFYPPDTNNGVLIGNCLFTNNSVSGVISFESAPLVLLLRDCTFCKNQGTSVFIYSNNDKGLDIGGKVIFEDNVALLSGGIYINDYSSVRFLENSIVTFNNNKADTGGAIRMRYNTSLLFDQGSTVVFHNNKATALSGGAIAAFNSAWIKSKENSVIKFINNSAAAYGGAMSLNSASVTFESSIITINNNSANKGANKFESSATYGGAMSLYNASVIFKNSIVTINNNSANQYGGALHNTRNSIVIIKGKSIVSFSNNVAVLGGAALFSQYNSNIKIDNNSIVTFSSNYVTGTDGSGGTIYMLENCYIFFEHASIVMFANNIAGYCGAVHCYSHSHIQIIDRSSVTFSHNRATSQYGQGGGLCVSDDSGITINNNSTVTFFGNGAAHGGAIFIEPSSYLLIDGKSSVLFSNNNAIVNGGALLATSGSIIFKGNSFVKLSNNIAKYNGGALYIQISSKIAFIENCMAVFYNNEASRSGGAMYMYGSSSAMHNKSSEVIYSNNRAKYGGAVCSVYHSNVMSDEESKLTFGANMAFRGGAIELTTTSTLSITGNSVTKFTTNKALLFGGAIKVDNSSIIIKGKSNVMISNNGAEKGGAVHCDPVCQFVLTDDSSVSFCNNEAKYFGGAINLVEYSEMIITEKSKVIFNNNTAKLRAGGAIHQINSQSTIDENSTVTFHNCQAKYGGSVAVNQSTITFTGYSLVKFVNGAAVNGVAIMSYTNSSIVFKGNTTVFFTYDPVQNKEEISRSNYVNNTLSTQDAETDNKRFKTIVFSSGNSAFVIEKNHLVKFNNNTARWCSGELYFNCSYDVIVDSNGTVTCNGIKAFPICTNNDICFCKNIEHVLADLTMSDGVVIRLTKDVILSSIVVLTNVTNFTMIGYNELSVTCSNHGGLYFISCHECTFESITWSKCGSDGIDSQLAAGLTFKNSSNITIQNCSFEQSVWQAVALLEVSGDVNIHQSKFVNNKHYKGHGTAIHYASNSIKYSLLKFIISNCDFIGNTNTMSIIYIQEYKTFLHKIFFLRNSSFVNNEGIPVYLSNQILYIEGRNNFVRNQAENGSSIHASNYASVIFSNHSVNWFDHNTAVSSGAIYLTNHACVSFGGNSKVQFNNNNATQYGGSIYSNDNSTVLFEGTANVQFTSSRAEFGGALYSEGGSHVIFDQKCAVTFDSNKADFGGAAYVCQQSDILIMDNSSLNFQNNLANEDGGALYLYNTFDVVFMSNTSVTFYNNEASRNGGAVYFKSKSKLESLQGNSSSTLNSDRVDNIGEISKALLKDEYASRVDLHSSVVKHNENDVQSNVHVFSIIFKGRSKIAFVNNNAVYGGAIYNKWNIRFAENSTTTFINNNADYGGAAYLETNGSMMFEGDCATMLTHKNANQNLAVSYYIKFSTLCEGNSIATFGDNTAKYNGGAIYLGISSTITFVKNSRCKAIFRKNKAANGGAMFSEQNSSIILGGKSAMMFANNEATHDGGAVHCYNKSSITITGHSCVKFYYNKATQGGAIYSKNSSNIIFKQNSITEFINNTGLQHGGALFTELNCDVCSEENSTVIYNGNNALINGGTVNTENNSSLVIMGYSRVIFNASRAQIGDGGAIYSNINCKIVSKGRSQLTLTNNYATQGGAIYTLISSAIVFDENTTVTFENNIALISGGALTANADSYVAFHGSLISLVKFNNNKAVQYGGAINVAKNSAIVLNGNMTTKFINNEAILGGAVNVQDLSIITVTGNSTAMFIRNRANVGGAIYLETSNMSFTMNCSIEFCNNTAEQDGGAIYLDADFIVAFANNANITFDYNTASDYGGAVYGKISHSKLYFNTTNITFYNNHVKTAGNSMFINVPSSCNSSCVSNNIVGISSDSIEHTPLTQSITTTPKVLKLYKPVCIKDDAKECSSYYVNNIMLGEEVLVSACMYDYYDRPSDDARFVVTGSNNQDYYIPGAKDVIVSCNNTLQGITLNGNNILPASSLNYSMTITLYVDRLSEMKAISVNLTVGLVSCHPGFWQYPESKKCECYNANDIVLCSSNSSTIKRGYWFGSVTGRPTVIYCPFNYCNFTCCKTSNGYYHLSPERDDQCTSHRYGAACGSCKEGYSLSFDSAECVNVKSCTTKMMILVIGLVVVYWLLLFGAIIFMMRSKINIGNFYGIIYYYSVVDLLLSHSSYLSNALYTTVNIMSSVTKVTPQFLGQFCLIKNMSGIDQQFIHYIHPIAISLFLGILTVAARKFQRLLSLVSVRVICCLLLLSYTSLATTSMLLMRPLWFQDIDKVYTYVSPDIEYFYGRHKFYEIGAGVFMLIVVGLPLLFGLEPFVNSKINFVKIKPLLDQFQCCYKGKYHYFAAYYMICRLVIIIIIIAAPSSDFIFQYLLITACVVIALIHHILKPYHNDSLNRFDGTILQLLVLVSVLPLVEFFDTFNSDLIVGIAFALIVLPSVIFFIMALVTNKEKINKLFKFCYFKCLQLRKRSSYNEVSLNETGESSNATEDPSNQNEFATLIIDDSMRRNAIICDV